MRKSFSDHLWSGVIGAIIFSSGALYGAWRCETEPQAKAEDVGDIASPFSEPETPVLLPEDMPTPSRKEAIKLFQDSSLRRSQVDWADARGYHSPEACEFALAWDIYNGDKSTSSVRLEQRPTWSLERAREFMAAAGYPQEVKAEKETQ